MMEAGTDVLSTVTSYARHDFVGVFRGAVDLVKVVSGNSQSQQADRISRQTKTSPADVVCCSFQYKTKHDTFLRSRGVDVKICKPVPIHKRVAKRRAR